MKKSNLMAIGVAVCMLSACGSSEDVDAVAATFMTGSDSVSEKDAKCLAKNIKKNASEDQWNKMVAKANGEIDDSETTMENMGEQMEEVMALMAPIAIASKECGLPLGQ